MRIFAFMTLDDPAANNGTFATGIDSADQVVGSYNDTSGDSHGFLYAGGSYTSFTDSDAGNGGDTLPDAINSVGTDWQTVGIAPYQSIAAPVGPFSLSASDPIGVGDWLTQAMQTPQNGIDGWLTQAMQASGAANQSSLGGPGIGSPSPVAGTSLSAAGPGFDAGWPLITGISGLAVPPVVTPNPLQTHTA
jgi:hypothetical protein